MSKFYLKCCSLSLVMLLSITTIFAQQAVTGRVTDANGALTGVTVSVIGTTRGTQTDANGAYSIQASDGETLRFSMIGYASQDITVGSTKTIHVVLESDAGDIGEVVVTAMGIQRERKTLGYSFQEIKGEAILERRENNIANALSGQVAGLQVVRGSNGPAGSSKLVLRGFNSLTGDNQPLIVVDGIPMDNFTGAGNNDYWNPDTDMGSGIADINPDDIESLSILKGGAASALYGSRAGNGVVLITTKKGRATEGAGITYNATVGFERLFMIPELQSQYGQGSYGNFNALSTSSWGPRIEGQQVTKWDGTTDNLKAYDNINEFMNTGFNTTHNLSFQQQLSQSTSLFTSGTYLHDNSRVPGATLGRLNLTSRAVSNFGENKKWTSDIKVQYINNVARNRPLSGNNTSNYFGNMLQTPRSFNILDLYPGTDEFGNHFYHIPATSAVNPYWNTQWNQNLDSRDRFLLNASLKYQFNDWLHSEVRIGSDLYNTRTERKTYASSPLTPTGSFTTGINSFNETNYIANITASKENLVGKWGGSFALFGQVMTTRFENVSASSGELEVPNLFSVNNGINPPSVNNGRSAKQINSLFANAEINYDGYWYITATGRNDWSSSLHANNRSYFYPSVSTSLVVSEMITKLGGDLPSWLSFTKLRGSYATVGNDLDPFSLYNLFNIGKDPVGTTVASRQNVLNNPNILSELIRTFELGTEINFFNNRLGLDLTYYKTNATNQIIGIPMNPLSGYTSRRINAGNIENSGFEAILRATIINNPEGFSWHTTTNLARNRNRIVSLADDIDIYPLVAYDNLTINAIADSYYGDIYGKKFLRVDDINSEHHGKWILSESGLPRATTEAEYLGNQMPKALVGFSNTFSYKNFSGSFLIDARFGGEIYSASQFWLQQAGVAANTVINGSREGYIVPGVIPDDAASSGYRVNNTEVLVQDYYGAIGIDNLGITEHNIYDATNVRLRNVALNYTIPRSLLGNSVVKRARIGVSANNLWMIHSKMNGIDPESVFATGSNAIGFESFSPPTGRTFFFNVQIGF